MWVNHHLRNASCSFSLMCEDLGSFYSAKAPNAAWAWSFHFSGVSHTNVKVWFYEITILPVTGEEHITLYDSVPYLVLSMINNQSGVAQGGAHSGLCTGQMLEHIDFNAC